MKYWVNCFIVRCPCFPERKYLLRSGLVVVTISRVSWRRTRETKHLGSMKITIILLGQWVNKLSAEAKWYWQCWPTPLVIHMELLQASAQAEEKVLSWVQVRTRNLVNNGLLRLKINLVIGRVLNLGRKEVFWIRRPVGLIRQHCPQYIPNQTNSLRCLMKKGVPVEKCYIPISLLKMNDFH